MTESEPPDRLARLGERLNRANASRDGKPEAGSDGPVRQQDLAVGLRIGVELVVAIVLATLLGWALDRWLGTAPWVTIVLFFLGVAAGMLNVYRALAGIKTPVGLRRPGPPEAGLRRIGDKSDDEE